MKTSYEEFLKTALAEHWKRIGLHRRSGVATPLFSIYSKKSMGVGEIPDLILLGEWCRRTGQSIIQLLPLNDVGNSFRPYDAESSFALEPMHLCLEALKDTPIPSFKPKIQALRKKYTSRKLWYDTEIKKEKLGLLLDMFRAAEKKRSKKFEQFIKDQHVWLRDYALFRILKDKMGGQSWETWPQAYRDRKPATLDALERSEVQTIRFHQWLQWQLYEQMTAAHRVLSRSGVRLMGDIPFLVSRDSADVWAERSNFKLDRSSGAPPDLYFADGQEWGMPPYDWAYLESSGYEYFIRKLQYAGHFYDMYRIDHFIGLFRLWTFPREAGDDGKRQGAFDPADEDRWEPQGRKILRSFLSATHMLPCAEDLGTVPLCATRVLADEAVPGMDIQRWTREWDTTGEFKSPEAYRKNAVATLSTHDMNAFNAWWEFETKPEERSMFWQYLGLEGVPHAHATGALLTEALKKVSRSRAIFCIQSLQDWLSLGHVFGKADPEVRINVPGVVSSKNWTLRAPVPLDDWGKFPFNDTILKMNQETQRERPAKIV